MKFSPACILLALLAACSSSGNDSFSPGGATPVASVALSVTTLTLSVGQSATLAATTLDASGATLAGRSVTWSSSAVAVASVNGSGLVLGVATGSADIIATSEGRSAIAKVTVGSVVGSCAGSPLTLALGEVRVLTGGDRSQLCISGGAGGSEYALIPFSREATGTTSSPVAFTATGTSAIVSAPFLRVPDVPAFAQTALNVSRESALRLRERAELSPRFGALRASLAAAMQPAIPGRRAITGLGTSPAVGTLTTLNTQGDYACTNVQLSTGRVMVVSQRAIILADTGAPANGFTTADYQDIAAAFDTLVFPVDSANFGNPTDIDGNGRALIFFTQTVNAQTAPASQFVLGGYFFARDLFPTTGSGACPGSNQGEMFYMPVVDAASKYNADFKDRAALKLNSIATLAHEFEHLINASRRIYITPATDFEEVWLDEGLAHIAEELAYYRSAGLQPRTNLDGNAILATQALKDAVNNYQVQNLARLSAYLKAPEANSPLDTNVTLATRGAAWQFLRYAADRRGGTETATWRALVDSPYTGLTSIAYVFGDAYSYLREWAVAQFTDDAGFSVDATRQFPSWNYRSVLLRLNTNNNTYPLATRPLLGSASFAVLGGSAAYVRFRVNTGLTGTVSSTIASIVDLILVRTQ
jgi:hypothetical protein